MSPRARRAVPAVALVLLLLGVAIAVVVRRSGPAHPPTGPLPVRTDVAFGAWTPPTSGPPGAGIAELEQALGRRLDIVADYPQWGADEAEFSPDDAARLRAEAADGRVPLLTWEPWDGSDGADRSAFSLQSIAEGRHDRYVRSWAEGLRDHAGPVYLRPMHEMNTRTYPWGGGRAGSTPERYVAAWRHLHDVFTAAQANNVRWVWAPNARDGSERTPLERYWPGGGYVDVLGLDGYNCYTGWRPFTAIFSDGYRRVTRLDPAAPVWVTETASCERDGERSSEDKAAWIREMFAAPFPRLRAIVWFNERKKYNWPITSSAAATAAARAALAGRAPVDVGAVE